MAAVARLGDQSDHDGSITTSCSQTYAEGKLIARVGDSHKDSEYYAPFYPHGTTTITSGSTSTVFVEGKAVALSGSSETSCGATISSGAQTVQAT